MRTSVAGLAVAIYLMAAAGAVTAPPGWLGGARMRRHEHPNER